MRLLHATLAQVVHVVDARDALVMSLSRATTAVARIRGGTARYRAVHDRQKLHRRLPGYHVDCIIPIGCGMSANAHAPPLVDELVHRLDAHMTRVASLID